MQTSNDTILIASYSRYIGWILVFFGLFYYIVFELRLIGIISLASGGVCLLGRRWLDPTPTIFLMYVCGEGVAVFTAMQTGGVDSTILAWMTLTPIIWGFVYQGTKPILYSTLFTILVIFLTFLWTEAQLQRKLIALMALSGTASLNMLLAFAYTNLVAKNMNELKDKLEMIDRLKKESLRNERLASVGLLSAGIAHQLGNTINTISVSSHNLSRALKKDSLTPAKVERAVASINKAVESSKLVIDGLDFSTKENTVPGLFSAKSIVDVSVSLLQGKILEQVKIDNRLEPEMMLFATKSALIQIFMNLISNSIDAVKGKKERWITINGANNGSRAVIEITDSGDGVENPDILLEAFTTTKDEKSGSGLGLYIVKKEVDGSAGSVSFSKTLPFTVRVELPYKDSA